MASLSRNGLHADDGHRVRLRVGLESRMLEQAERLDSIVAGDPRLASSPGGATLFKREAAGALVRTPKGAVSRSKIALQSVLAAVLDDLERDSGQRPVIPRTPRSGDLSTCADLWA